MGNSDITYKIRPAARIIHTIGQDLIGDPYAALVELVKNSYDADASKVEINFEFKLIDGENALVITVKDNGHGMNFDTVINKWLVPATNDKLKRKFSYKNKRPLQGRKGIGRFAAAILGQELTLSSIDQKGKKSTAVIDWRIFESDQLLENVELLIEQDKVKLPSGTVIEIIAKDENNDFKLSYWNKKTVTTLIQELRKLISPFSNFENDKFNITIAFINNSILKLKDPVIQIENYPIIEFYDYRISGEIDTKGNATLKYENNITEHVQIEKINKKLILTEGNKYCGNIKIDFRVFDREPEAISNLIKKGLKDPISNNYIGKQEARRLLNEAYGAKIYKNNFRIRPYGSDGVDWLNLDKNRIQNPTLRISNNQLIGFITIESEELSNLEEKSARDGLKENEFFSGLKEMARLTLKELEQRRFHFRVKSRKSRPSIQNTISDLFSFKDLSDTIEEKLKQLKVSNDKIEQIKLILKKEEKSKTELLGDIQDAIAIYQGQATLGKIVNFILHEGRKPLQGINADAKIITNSINHFKKTKDEALFVDIDNSIEGLKRNSKFISGLFNRVNPLASKRRGKKKDFHISRIINASLSIFKNSILESKISIDVSCDNNLTIHGWEEDLLMAITNIIENSIYWLNTTELNEKQIKINVAEKGKVLVMDFLDNGPGLSDDEINSDVIFEPGYSKKHNGTGLGLAIAGESVERLGGVLKAKKHDKGAHFLIEIIKT